MKDPISDINLQTLSAYSKQFLGGNLPEFVKSAETGAVKVPDKSPISVYGNPANATFPCHNKVATYLSNLYLFAGQANGETWDSGFPFEKVAERLENHAKFWGIWPEVSKMRGSIEKASTFTPETIKDEDYALVVKYAGSNVRRFPIVTAPMVKASAEALMRDKVNYPYEWRKTAARKILNAATTLGVSIPNDHFDYLFKAAGCAPETPKYLAKQILARALELPLDFRDKLSKMAAVVYKNELDVREHEKLATLLDSVERALEKTYLYAQGLPLPEEICFRGPEVKVASANTVTLINGATFDLEEIKKAGLEPLSAVDGVIEHVVEDDKGTVSLKKISEVLPTLPLDTAQTLQHALAACGVKPIESEKTAGRQENVKKVSSMDEWIKFSKENGSDAEPLNWCVAFKPSHPQKVAK